MSVLTTQTVAILAPARLLTTNAERRLHWSKRADIAASWRATAYLEAKLARCVRLDCAEVEFHITQAKGRLADASAHHPVTKAVLDGLIDAHVLPNDDPAHVVAITEHAPVRGPRNAVTVTIREVRSCRE